MSLINREDLLKKQCSYYDYNGEKIGVVRVSDIVEMPSAEPERKTVLISSQPTVDAVQVIRCKNCKYYCEEYFARVDGLRLVAVHDVCKFWGEGCHTEKDGYCAFGERKEE